jgi:hypothetical protein
LEKIVVLKLNTGSVEENYSSARVTIVSAEAIIQIVEIKETLARKNL